MNEEITVSVLCTTYNHEPFIRDALEGMVNQKTNFKFEIIIHDDASTDHTPDIIAEYEAKYPEVVKTICQKENQWRKCNYYKNFLFPVARGKYFAFCEGDDYWIDEYKLQKQVDFLENNLDYSMCMHDAIKMNWQTGEKKKMNTFEMGGTFSTERQIMAGLGTNFPAFASYMCRAALLNEIPDFFYEAGVFDYPLRAYYAIKGKIYYFSEAMSVYRVGNSQSYTGQCSTNQNFYNNYCLKTISFFEKFNQYTKQQYFDILESKIISDYYGFCVSITKKEGISKARENGLNIEKIEMIYNKLSPSYLQHVISDFIKRKDKIFIYGTSRLALLCKEQLDKCKICYEGFVVSDGQSKIEQIDNKKVYYLSEVLKEKTQVGFILAVQPINLPAILKILKDCNIQNYCIPYDNM